MGISVAKSTPVKPPVVYNSGAVTLIQGVALQELVKLRALIRTGQQGED